MENGRYKKEIWYIKPILFGGDPNEPSNVILVNRREHIELVKYWNKVLRKIKNVS
ncbi:hypothetical protein [Rodentibacter trehalosifermentans]|uniref:hypothetical protein n=1 Tax=Rodentibacter trehalosifermentans TaxID=1908263 RepID=UPI0015C318BF|nr:hypothetical protein [Rodentibacter trehalosifermentans]